MNFAKPILINLGGEMLEIASVDRAQRVLTEHWPTDCGPRHRDAIDTCLKVVDGHRSTVDAENAFRQAAEEAEIIA